MGEQETKKLLLNKGWKFVTQNYRTRFGEIDLIFIDNKTLVFVEAKTRSNLEWGTPEESISRSKLAKLRKAAEIFLCEHPVYSDWLYRIDVAAVEKKDDKLDIRLYENVYF